MKVREYIKTKDWDNFVKNHPNGNIFQSREMYDVYRNDENSEPILIIIFENNEVLGLLLAVIQKEFSGLAGNISKRSIIRGGPIIKDNNTEVLDLILRSYTKKIKNKAIYSQFRNYWDWKKLKNIFINNKFKYDEHLDILFDLRKSEEQLWKEVKRMRKKGINQAYKKGVTIKEVDLTNDIIFYDSYNILKDVYNRIKLPLPGINFFKNNINTLGKYILSLGLYVENELVAIRIVFCYNNLIYDWYAGAKDDYLNYRPNDVLPWEIMKWGIKNNYNTFSFGGAGKPNVPYGVRDYKLKFGGELVEYGRFEKVHQLFLMKIAKIGLMLWKKFKI